MAAQPPPCCPHPLLSIATPPSHPQVKGRILRFAQLADEATGGPLPALPGARRRRAAAAATSELCMQLANALLLVTYSEEAAEARRTAAGWPPPLPLLPAERRLVLAVGDQVRGAVWLMGGTHAAVLCEPWEYQSGATDHGHAMPRHRHACPPRLTPPCMRFARTSLNPCR